MSGKVDLHIHTIFSDGSMTPEKIVELSIKKGLSHIAITDHDTRAGVMRAIEHSKRLNGPEVIPAVEFSSHLNGDEVHILAYYIPFDNAISDELLSKAREYNLRRFLKVLKVVNRAGFNVEIDDFPEINHGVTVLAPQIMKTLVSKGQLSSEQEGFEFFKNYLVEQSPDFVYHDNHPSEIIELCKAAGAISSIAHPHKLHFDENLIEVIKMGVDAIEYFYPHVPDTKRQLNDELIKEHNLLKTGGSDFHAAYKPGIDLGDAQVPVIVVEKMQEFLKTRI